MLTEDDNPKSSSAVHKNPNFRILAYDNTPIVLLDLFNINNVLAKNLTLKI